MARLQLFAFGIKLFQGDEAVEVTYHILCSSINDMTAIVTWLRILPFGHYDILFEDKGGNRSVHGSYAGELDAFVISSNPRERDTGACMSHTPFQQEIKGSREVRSSWGYMLSQQQQRRSETTSPGDYHDHLSKMIRTPSILPGVPHYPNVHKAFKKSKVASSEEGNIANVNEEKQPEPLKGHGHNKSSKHSAQFQEKVEAIEFEEEAQTASSCGKNRKAEVPRESFDSKADGYIQKRHRRFELCTWATFKLQ